MPNYIISALKLERRDSIFLVILGTILGLLSFFSPGTLFFICLLLLTIFFINRIPDNKERTFILFIFLAGFIARIILSLLTLGWAIFAGKILNYVSSWSEWNCPDYSTPYLIGDSGYYTLRSLYMSMYWLGKPLTNMLVTDFVKGPYGAGGFNYILASYFTIFGYSPITSRFINCFFGTITAIIIYFIVKDIFGGKIARLSSLLILFFPSLFFWSITNLKEASFTFLIYIMLWAIIKFESRKKIYYLIMLVLSISLQYSIRPSYKEFLYINIATCVIYFSYSYFLSINRKKKLSFFIFIFIASLLVIYLQRSSIIIALNKITKSLVIAQLSGSDVGLNYKLLPDEVYEKFDRLNYLEHYFDYLRMLANGWLHITFEPFPWRITQSRAMLFIFPFTMLRYLMIGFAILGIIISVRYRFKESFILLLYFFVMTSVVSVTESNIGTMFRVRDFLTPILLIFASLALINAFGRLDLNTSSLRGSESCRSNP